MFSVFLIHVFNNFVKFYSYCRVNCLEVPTLKVISVSILLFIYNLLVWSNYCNFNKKFNNFIYFSMPIDNGACQARVGLFYVLKFFFKGRSKTKEFSFLQHPVYFSLILILYFGKFLLKNAYHAFNCMLTGSFLKPYLYSITKLPKYLASLTKWVSANKVVLGSSPVAVT